MKPQNVTNIFWPVNEANRIIRRLSTAFKEVAKMFVATRLRLAVMRIQLLEARSCIRIACSRCAFRMDGLCSRDCPVRKWMDTSNLTFIEDLVSPGVATDCD